jgi:cytochrome P450
MVPATNRDPEVFADPDRFDISRGAQQHLSFGWGSHLCMGPHVTRIIAEEVIGLLLEEFPALAWASGWRWRRASFTGRR